VKDFNAIKTPNGWKVVFYYFIRFGYLYLIIILVYGYLYTGSFPSLRIWASLPFAIYIGNLWIYLSERIVYRVTIDYEKEELVIFHFFRRKKKTKIPFKNLRFEFFRKTLTHNDREDWVIKFGKKSTPTVGQLYSQNKYSYWSKQEIKDLSDELINIAQNYETWQSSSTNGKSFYSYPKGVVKVQAFE